MRLIPVGLALSVALCGTSAPVSAGESSIWWPEWTISSTEDLSEIDDGEKAFLHPLSALFDANSKTTWVMSPKATLEPMYLQGTDPVEKLFGKSNRGLLISTKARSHKGVAPRRWMSGLQIMNGNNSSEGAFAAGNRIRTLRVTLLDGKKRHCYTFPIQNKMGWQRVSWPRQRAEKVAIEFADVLNPRKPVCASGLGLLDGTREIKWNMPQVVMFHDGLEGEGAHLLLNRRGQILDGLADDDGPGDAWSKGGRFVAAMRGDGGTHTRYVWVADAKKGRIIRKIPPRTSKEILQVQWISARQLKIESFRLNKENNWKPFDTRTYRF